LAFKEKGYFTADQKAQDAPSVNFDTDTKADTKNDTSAKK
jgi:hypothetical protein